MRRRKREGERGIEYKAACITIFFIRYKSLELFSGLEMASWTCPPRREKKIQPVTAEVKRISIFFSLSLSTIGFELCEDIFINSWMILFLISCIDRVEGSFFYIFYYIQDNVRFYFYFPVLFWEILLRNFFGNKFVRIYIDTLFRVYLSFFIISLFEN